MDPISSNNGAYRMRTSCDRCQTAKMKCSRTRPACGRCLKGGHQCVYSLSKRIGRPPKSASAPEAQSQPSNRQLPDATLTLSAPEICLGQDNNTARQQPPVQGHSESEQQVLDHLDIQQSIDSTASCLNETIIQEQINGAPVSGGEDLDLLMQMTTGAPWLPPPSAWPTNTPVPSEQIPMLESMLDMEQYDVELPAISSLETNNSATGPVTGLPSPDSTHIHPAGNSISDNLSSAFFWEADLFGGIANQSPSMIEDHTRPSISADLAAGANLGPGTFDSCQSRAPSLSRGSSSAPLKRKSAVLNYDQHKQRRSRTAGTSQQSRGTPTQDTASSSIVPPCSSLSLSHSLQCTLSQDESRERPLRSLTMQQREQAQSASQPSDPGTPMSESYDNATCTSACYSALLAQLMRLVECDGGDGFALDGLLDLHHGLHQKKDRALQCSECMPRSTSRATLILMLNALNNLVGLFEQKFSPLEEKGGEDDGYTSPSSSSLPSTWPSIATSRVHNTTESRSTKDEESASYSISTEKPLVVGSYLVEGNVKLRFLHELLSSSLERLVTLLKELEQAAHTALKNVNYKVIREMLKDLPQRIFFLRGRLALVASVF